LSNLAKEIWKWCEERNLWIFASYISSENNTEADEESRKLQENTELELKLSAFNRIVKKFGKPDIDLFASRVNATCRKYVSWKKDHQSIAVDAFYLYSAANTLLERIYPGSRNFVKQNCERRGIPTELHDVILQSLSEASWKQYDTGWKKWWKVCIITNTLDPFEINIQSVFWFLTEEFKEGASYGTLNSYRSSLSMITGSWLAHDESLKRFFKGIARARPNKPKYDSTMRMSDIVHGKHQEVNPYEYLNSACCDACQITQHSGYFW
uniref:Core-binding (CB) domain-containing protein n=1 Tax=Phlebotomus papatasi TaxID=29031 RepID=A0A1B0DIH8_PHLPP